MSYLRGEKKSTQTSTKVYYSRDICKGHPKLLPGICSHRVAFRWNHRVLGFALSVVSQIPVSWNRVLRAHVRVQFPARLPFCYPAFPSLPVSSTQCWWRHPRTFLPYYPSQLPPSVSPFLPAYYLQARMEPVQQRSCFLSKDNGEKSSANSAPTLEAK